MRPRSAASRPTAFEHPDVQYQLERLRRRLGELCSSLGIVVVHKIVQLFCLVCCSSIMELLVGAESDPQLHACGNVWVPLDNPYLLLNRRSHLAQPRGLRGSIGRYFPVRKARSRLPVIKENLGGGEESTSRSGGLAEAIRQDFLDAEARRATSRAGCSAVSTNCRCHANQATAESMSLPL